MQSGVDVFDATITQIDGERDPRCLLVVADVLEALSQVRSRSSTAPRRMSSRGGAESHAASEARQNAAAYVPGLAPSPQVSPSLQPAYESASPRFL